MIVKLTVIEIGNLRQKAKEKHLERVTQKKMKKEIKKQMGLNSVSLRNLDLTKHWEIRKNHLPKVLQGLLVGSCF